MVTDDSAADGDMAVVERIEALRTLIRHHEYRYYVLDSRRYPTSSTTLSFVSSRIWRRLVQI